MSVPDSDPACTAIRGRDLAALVTIALAVTLIVMDGSIVNVALPTFVEVLGGASNSQLQWIVDAYILCFATLLLAMGNLADRFGRRRLLLLGSLVFGLTSLGAASASTPGTLIAWRCAMGVGAAMIFPSTLAILTHTFRDPSTRRIAIGVWAACSGLGVAIGPVVGGWILVQTHWSWIFLINLPIVLVIGLAGRASIDESREPEREPLDLVGNLIAIVGLLALVFGLIEGPDRGWTHPLVAGALTLAVVMGVLLRWQQTRAVHPVLDPSFVRSRGCVIGCLAIAAAFFGLFGFVFLVTQFLQFVRGHDPLAAGIRTLPFAGAILVGAVLAARGANRLPARVACASGLALMATGFGWAGTDGQDTPYSTLAMQMTVLGVGLGLVSATATEVVMGALRSERFGLASSLNDTSRELGGTIGVAFMGSVFNMVYRGDLDEAFAGSPLPEDARTAVAESLGVAMTVIDRVAVIAGPDAAQRVRMPVFEAFMAGFHAASLVATGLAAVGVVVVLAFLPARVLPEPEPRAPLELEETR